MVNYLEISPKEICEDINSKIKKNTQVIIDDMQILIKPHVYPSHLFQTPIFIINSLKELFLDRSFCDMGCGPGTIGLAALKYGASLVVQVDINPFAVNNAQLNRELNKIDNGRLKIYESNCFENVPPNSFDLICFNIPFHPDEIEINDPLDRAFFDPNFETLNKFLLELPSFTHTGSQIFIAFTNRVNPLFLENLLEKYKYKWILWKKASRGNYDNRLYKIEF